MKRGAPILVEYLGGAVNCDAHHMTDPRTDGQHVVLEGSFKPHIGSILHDKAASMGSPIVSASAPGNRSSIKGIKTNNGKPYQVCDILIDVEKDLHTVGWKISNESICVGLERACLAGRSQFLTPEEAEAASLLPSL